MEAFGGFIIFASFAAFILGVINIIRPQGWMKVQKRLVGVFIILGSMGGCVAGATMLPPAPPVTAETSEEVPAKADKPRPVKAARAPAAAAPEPAAKVTGLTQGEFNSMWSEMLSVVGRCDDAVAQAQRVLQSGDAYAAYPLVQGAQSACGSASLEAHRVEVPRSAKGAVRGKLRDARDACSLSVSAKQIAMQSVGKVVNGDSRPSAVAKAKQDMEYGSQGALRCAVGFMAAANEAGLVLPDSGSGR